MITVTEEFELWTKYSGEQDYWYSHTFTSDDLDTEKNWCNRDLRNGVYESYKIVYTKKFSEDVEEVTEAPALTEEEEAAEDGRLDEEENIFILDEEPVALNWDRADIGRVLDDIRARLTTQDNGPNVTERD